MKDSGVEWLGEIPAHWETTKRFEGILLTLDRRITYGIVHPEQIYQVDRRRSDREGQRDLSQGPSHGSNLFGCTTREYSKASMTRSRLKVAKHRVYAIRGSIGDVAIVSESETRI